MTTYDVYWLKQAPYNFNVRVYDDTRDKAVDLLISNSITDYEYGRDQIGFFFKFANPTDAVLFRMAWDV